MPRRAPLRATFFALWRREKRGVLFRVSFVYLVAIVLLGLAFVGLNWRLFSIDPNSDADSVYLPLTVAMFWLLPFTLVFFVLHAAYETAVLRWILRGEVCGLTFGADTWRVFLGYCVGGVTLVAISLLVGLINSTVLLLGARLMSGAPGGQAALFWAISFTPLLSLAMFAAIALPLAARFGPGHAASILTRRFAYLGGWKASRTRAWALIGSLLWIWVLSAVMAAVLFIGSSIVAAVGGVTRSGLPVWTVFFAFVFAMIAWNMVVTMLTAGVGARAALVAIDEGRLDGVSPGLARVFE